MIGNATNAKVACLPQRWSDALMAARLFAVDPAGLCGVALRARPGPVRESWMRYLIAGLGPETPVRRMPPGIQDDRLMGGIDLVATLAAGRPLLQNGILVEANGGVLVIPMAERLTAGVAARIAGVTDRGEISIEREGIARRVSTRIGVVALDEGATDEERLPNVLSERFAFHIDVENVGALELGNEISDGQEIQAARTLLDSVDPASDDLVAAIAKTALSFGIYSVVACLLALRAARVAAALAGRTEITIDDAVVAARLTLAPRAVVQPAAESRTEEPRAPEPMEQSQQSAGDETRMEHSNQDYSAHLEDIVRAAMQSALPAGLLQTQQNYSTQRAASHRGSGIGREQASLLRGRPAGVRMGPMRAGARLALVDTLRAAAPWQKVRRAAQTADSGTSRIIVCREDFRFKKFVQPRVLTAVFCVDASGSMAFHRLAEAKGAVERMLAEAYVARTHAALIAFRGRQAELLLPPSRSLTRARTLMSTLPGGGGTPLACGIDSAVLVALAERAKGRDPLIVLLTDGRANIARDGQADSRRAWDEALFAAGEMGRQRISAVFVDTSARMREEGPALASAMRARYVALPRIDASALCDVVRAAIS